MSRISGGKKGAKMKSPLLKMCFVSSTAMSFERGGLNNNFGSTTAENFFLKYVFSGHVGMLF